MRISKIEKRNYFLYFLIVLSSVGFFNPFEVFSPVTQKAMFYGCSGLAWAVAISNHYNNNSAYNRKCYGMIMIGILSSIIMAMVYQEQSLTKTIISTFPTMIAYGMLPLFCRLNIDQKLILKALWFFVIAGMVVYVANFVAYPDFVFGQEKEEFDLSRGLVRIKIPFIEIFVLMFFYSINKWTDGIRSKKWIFMMLALLVFIILSVTRQTILLSFVLGGWMILRRSTLVKRLSVILIGVLFYVIVLPNIPIYKTMMELTEQQVENNNYGDEDIRVQAWRFYTYEYQTNELTPILGNGVPSMGKSKWGKDFEQTVARDAGGNGCYGADVGWAGFFWNFGGIATFGLFMLLLHAFRKNKSSNEQYLSYWILYVMVTNIASGSILYHYQIVSVMTVLYLIYGKKQKEHEFYNRTDYPQLQ